MRVNVPGGTNAGTRRTIDLPDWKCPNPNCGIRHTGNHYSCGCGARNPNARRKRGSR